MKSHEAESREDIGYQHTGKRIGELNGPWAFLFKITQIAIPMFALTIIPWGVWVTKTAFDHSERFTRIESWMSVGPRFTPNDAENMRLRILKEVELQNDASFNRVSMRLDALTLAINELKLELTRHAASTHMMDASKK